MAQTINAPTAVERRGERGTLIATRINRKDCLRNERITFALPVTTNNVDLSGYQLEVWVGAGSDCNTDTSRMGSSPTCWRVQSDAAWSSPTASVDVYARDIIGKVSVTAGASAETVCTPTDTNARGPTAVKLHFMFLNSAGLPPMGHTAGTWDAEYDVIGPPAPRSVRAGIGERALVVSWREPEGTGTLNGYELCWEALGAELNTEPPDAGTGDAGIDDAGTDAGTSDAGTDAGTSDAGTDAGTSDAGTDAGIGAGGAGAVPTECTSLNLIPGEPPRSGTHCDLVTGSSSTTGEAKPLTNGVRYVVAVAAQDDFQNPGDLSALRCGTPEPVTGFFEAYRAAGGGAGGGYCAIGAVPSRAAAAGIVFAALGLLLRRRRRAARNNVRGAA
jgi:hypothetical protein